MADTQAPEEFLEELTPEEVAYIKAIRERGEKPVAESAARAVTPMDDLNRWGPFLNYQYIQTPHGFYGLPAGQIMWFEHESVMDYKLQEKVTRPMPHYEEVQIDDPRLKPDYEAKPTGAKKR